MYYIGNSCREQHVMLSSLPVNQNSIFALLDIPCLWTSFNISPQIVLHWSQRQGDGTTCGCTYRLLLAVGLMSEVTTCIKSCPALYNSSAHWTCHIWPPLGVVGIFIQKMWQHAYLKLLPKQRTEAKLRDSPWKWEEEPKVSTMRIPSKKRNTGREVFDKLGSSEERLISCQCPKIRQGLHSWVAVA